MLTTTGTRPLLPYDCDPTIPPVEDQMCAIIAATGKLTTARNAAGLIVVGWCTAIREGKAEVESGYVILANDPAAGGTVKRSDRGKPVYIKDPETVTQTKGAGMVAGVVVDVSEDGVLIDCTPAALAAASLIS